MSSRSGRGDTKVYAIIAILVVIVLVLTIFFSTNTLREAKIEDEALDDSWIEDIDERDSGSNFLGLEKWVSYTYKNDDILFPSYISVTSSKNLFMISDSDLFQQTLNTINQASEQGIILDEDSKITGERVNKEEHKTYYVVYNGTDTSFTPNENIKIIGECWNCGVSGSSVICIGYAQITNHSMEGMSNISYWSKIIRDKEGTFGLGDFQGLDGLIFNVDCH